MSFCIGFLFGSSCGFFSGFVMTYIVFNELRQMGKIKKIED